MKLDLSSSYDTLVGTIDLREESVIANNSNPASFTCNSSTLCCDKLEIQITDLDIYRIEQQGYHPDQFIQVNSTRIKIPGRPHEQPLKYHILRKREFDRRCVFLESNMCKIHQFKPHSCRIFSFQLKIIDENTIEVHTHPSKLCNSLKAVENNQQILENIMHIQIQEIAERIEYDLMYCTKNNSSNTKYP